MYYIYHIPGVKIGCSIRPEKRVKSQGYSKYQILEEYTDKDKASKREIELQKEYGYKVDSRVYGAQPDRKGKTITLEHKEKISKAHKGKITSLETKEKISKAHKANKPGRLYIEHTTGFIGSCSDLAKRFNIWKSSVIIFANKLGPVKQGKSKGLHFTYFDK